MAVPTEERNDRDAFPVKGLDPVHETVARVSHPLLFGVESLAIFKGQGAALDRAKERDEAILDIIYINVWHALGVVCGPIHADLGNIVPG